MTTPTFDFSIPLDINNIESKNQILELWEKAKNESLEDNREIITYLEQIIQLDDSLYGVWYNLGVAKEFKDGICFKKAIELKMDHEDSWLAKAKYHDLASNMPHHDDTLDKHLHIENNIESMNMPTEIQIVKKLTKIISQISFDEQQYSSELSGIIIENTDSSPNDVALNMTLCLMKYSYYEDAIKIIKNDVYYSEYLKLRFYHGICLRKTKRFQESIEMFNEILSESTKNPIVLLQKALSTYEKGEKKEAEEIFSEIKKLEMNDDLINQLCTSKNDFNDSFELLKNDFNENLINQLNKETEKLYNYNEREKIQLTYDYLWFLK